MKVIRCGRRDPRKDLPQMTDEQLSCLQGFWELEEQLGIRRRPLDDFLDHIPKIQAKPQGDSDDR